MLATVLGALLLANGALARGRVINVGGGQVDTSAIDLTGLTPSSWVPYVPASCGSECFAIVSTMKACDPAVDNTKCPVYCTQPYIDGLQACSTCAYTATDGGDMALILVVLANDCDTVLTAAPVAATGTSGAAETTATSASTASATGSVSGSAGASVTKTSGTTTPTSAAGKTTVQAFGAVAALLAALVA